MTYQQLQKIAKQYAKIQNNKLPQDAFAIAQSLSLQVKDTQQCKQDYHDDGNPWINNNARYALYKGCYTIYYNENYKYKNFAVAHEIAHHLLNHKHDSGHNHHDANMLAAILIAPQRLIRRKFIRSAEQLAEVCCMPDDIANEYWHELKANRYNFYNVKGTVLAVAAIVLILLFVGLYGLRNSRPMPSDTSVNVLQETETQERSVSVTDTNLVYITKTGEKYHTDNCKHISDKDNLMSLPLEQAVDMGYDPCKDCIK